MFTKVSRNLRRREVGDGQCGSDSYALNPEPFRESFLASFSSPIPYAWIVPSRLPALHLVRWVSGGAAREQEDCPLVQAKTQAHGNALRSASTGHTASRNSEMTSIGPTMFPFSSCRSPAGIQYSRCSVLP